MNRTTLLAACACVFVASVTHAQVIVSPPVVTTYYSPTPYAAAPVVSYYAPSEPVVTYAAPAPVTTYYAPAPAALPVTTYYAPTTPYYAPTTAYYAPATTTYYAGTVIVTPVVGRPITVGSSAYGTLRPYVPGQPVRNALRFFVP